MTEDREAEIHLAAYDEAWPELFSKERAVLAEALEPCIKGAIEHVGSTAVPGLLAKPVIDIMAGVESLAASKPAFPALEGIGYWYFPHRPHVMHWFCKPSPQFRTHHLHLVPYGSDLWRDRLAFRDYLRNHPAVAAEYAELKQGLARRYRDDREAYTDAKAPFVQDVLERALAGGASP